MTTPFWSPETEKWAARCSIESNPDEYQSKWSWAKMHIALGKGGSQFPSLAFLGSPNFVPEVETAKQMKPSPERVRKIKLQPTPAQRKILNKWFGTARWTYNQCVNAIREQGCERNKTALRQKCVHNSLWKDRNQWVLETPYEIRDHAMNDVLEAYKTNFAAKRKQFNIKYKSKKAASDSIVIGSRQWKSAGVFFPRFWGKQALGAHEPLPDKLNYDTRLQRTRMGEFYLCVLSPLVKRGESQAPPDTSSRVISLDPGVRTFQTGYCPSGSTLEIGKGDIGRIARLCWALDKLQSKWSQPTVRHRQRYSMKRAGHRIRSKIKNLIRDLHHKTAAFLCQTFRTILIPTFETKDMVSKVKRRIGSQTARMMLTWSHYRFRKILEDKARGYPWCSVFVVDEAYTSKTCGGCGSLHQSLGSNKTFQCPICPFKMDRDINGARNILLRFLTLDERVQPVGLALGPSPLLPVKRQFA